jgi:hypothetical protein
VEGVSSQISITKEDNMAEAAPALSRHDLEAKIVKRSWEDEAFRKEFTSDPTGTAAKYLKVPAAELPKIVVHQERAGSWHIVLPQKPANVNQLSEQDLEKVAGGVLIQNLVNILTIPITIAVSGGGAASAVVSTKENHGW